MSEIRYVIETDKGYGEDIAVSYSSKTPIIVKISEYTKDINKALQYDDIDEADWIASIAKGKPVPILVKEVIEVIK